MKKVYTVDDTPATFKSLIDAVRRPRSAIDPATHDLEFQLIDIKHSDRNGKTVVTIFGITASGNSVALDIHGQQTYFYVEIPDSATDPEIYTIAREVQNENPIPVYRHGQPKFQLTWSKVKARCLFKFEPEQSLLDEISSASDQIKLDRDRGILKTYVKFSAPSWGYMQDLKFRFMARGYEVLEHDISPDRRLMLDHGIAGGGWVRVRCGDFWEKKIVPRVKGRWTGRNEVTLHVQQAFGCICAFGKCITHASDECDCGKVPTNIADRSDSATWRLLSFDIECLAEQGKFPKAERDRVIQIGVMFTEWGKDGDLPITQRIVFMEGSCSDFSHEDENCVPKYKPDEEMRKIVPLVFEDENSLLSAFAEYVRVSDPDLMTGYNVDGFDWEYLIDRANLLGIAEDFCDVSRDAWSPAKIFSFGNSDKRISLSGRFTPDMLKEARSSLKLSSFTLNNVAEHVLGTRKLDMSYDAIPFYQNKSPETRRALAAYCLRDAQLVLDIMAHFNFVHEKIEMARITGIPPSFLSRGEQIKTETQLLAYAHKKSFVVPQLPPPDGTYGGGHVFPPEEGYYSNPIVILDFKSLYPSIIMSKNLDWSTLCDDPRIYHLAEKTPSGHYFVRREVRDGILPQMLRSLQSRRNAAKREMRTATGWNHSILNARQLALKLTANAMYGFTGAKTSRLPCYEIAGSVTGYGREYIKKVSAFLEKTFTVENGYPGNAKVVYGDTDSVMVTMGDAVKDPVQFYAISQEMAKACNESGMYDPPMELEVDGMMIRGFFKKAKKNYAAVMFDPKTGGIGKIKKQGIASVRRDHPKVVRDALDGFLERVLIHDDVKGAFKFMRELVDKLWSFGREDVVNSLAMDDFINSKKLSKDLDEYNSNSMHVRVAKRQSKENPDTPLRKDDRVYFVHTRGSKRAKKADLAMHPTPAYDQGVTLAIHRYVDDLKKHVGFYMKQFGADLEEFFKQPKSLPHPASKKKGTIGSYFKKLQRTCYAFGCRRVQVRKGLCDVCIRQDQHQRVEDDFTRALFTATQDYNDRYQTCIECTQGLDPDICVAVTCTNHFRIKDAKKRRDRAQDGLKRIRKHRKICYDSDTRARESFAGA